jgi:hypothetical protein
LLALVGVILLLIVLAVGPASADSGEMSILAGTQKVWELDVDDHFHLTYEVEVISGPNVNVLLLSDDAYAEYQRGANYPIITEGTNMNASSVSSDIDLEQGRYYLVVDPESDNLAVGDVPRIVYDINVVEDGSSNLLFWILAVGAIILFALVLIMLFDVIRAKRKK